MNYIDANSAPLINTGQIKLHGPEGFEAMRAVGRMAAACIDMLHPHVTPGMTTAALDKLAYEFILDHGAAPAPLNYRGFKKSICTSLNHVVCHGIPGERVLKEGDILNIDVTLFHKGWHGDHSRMFAVGEVPVRAKRLMDITYQSMMLGIEAVKPGATLGDIGHAIQSFAEAERLSVVRDFCGHGLGRIFHDAPNILHYGHAGQGITLQPGMIFTIEPMLNLGKAGVKILGDGWTAVTRDRSLSAQFEHSIGVTDDGYEIFTLSPSGLHQPHQHPPN
ncbi:MAG: type I methionyl aminopeptidase [Parvibaculales bacterium]